MTPSDCARTCDGQPRGNGGPGGLIKDEFHGLRTCALIPQGETRLQLGALIHTVLHGACLLHQGSANSTAGTWRMSEKTLLSASNWAQARATANRIRRATQGGAELLQKRKADVGPLIFGTGTARMQAITCAILVVLILAFGSAGRAHAAPCHQFTIARTVPPGFGAPFDVLSEGNAPLITGDCAAAGIAVSVGTQGQKVYRYGYIADRGQWQKLELAGTPYGDDWLRGPALVTLPRPADLDATVSFLAFTCTPIGGFIPWKCGCRDYYCYAPMWQLQTFRYGAAPPQPEVLTPNADDFFARAGEIRPDGSMILLDGHIVHTTNFWTRMLPDRVPSDFTSPINYTGGGMDVRLEVISMAGSVPFFYEVCLENGNHGMDGWGETCTQLNAPKITSPGIYTWSGGRPFDHWWQNDRRFDWQGGKRKRITINYNQPASRLERWKAKIQSWARYVSHTPGTPDPTLYVDDDLPLEVRLTIILTPEGKPFAGFD
jgi:hypothetical protein